MHTKNHTCPLRYLECIKNKSKTIEHSKEFLNQSNVLVV